LRGDFTLKIWISSFTILCIILIITINPYDHPFIPKYIYLTFLLLDSFMAYYRIIIPLSIFNQYFHKHYFFIFICMLFVLFSFFKVYKYLWCQTSILTNSLHHKAILVHKGFIFGSYIVSQYCWLTSISIIHSS
jgi:hypothetical protein